MATIEYEHEKLVSFDETKKHTILELSNANSIPHIQACGGKARCSTCRVIITQGIESIPERNEKEMTLARKKGFENNIRLACQTIPQSNLKVRRLVHDTNDIEVAVSERASTSGREEKLAILFSDIRGYTSFSEKALAYDTIHILNRYFKIMGNLVIQNFGYIDKYIGDGLMAIFGLEESRKKLACYDATNAGLEMISEMKNFNMYLKKNFEVEFEIGVGIHYGTCVIGNLGHNSKMQFTAIGDTVNIASRVESYNKELKTNLLVTESVQEVLKEKIQTGKTQDANLKGKVSVLKVYEVFSIVKEEKSLENKLREFLFQEVSVTDTPGLLRLVFHDVCSFDPQTNQGGFKAQILRTEFYSLPENEGLEKTVTKILEWYHKWNQETNLNVSKTDLIALSVSVGLEKSGLPRFSVGLGRKDAEFTEGIWDLPMETSTLDSIMKRFSELGFLDREIIALTGAHTLGKSKGKHFTQDPFTFNNAYFKQLLEEEKNPELALVSSDLLFLNVSSLEKIVREFAKDELEFFHEFTSAILKLLSIGQK
ncbi:MAG: peroxidase family protein [Leptospiraceae bacterium]|nr:peroxidase family protein [Leptospiraceae bacterium]